MKNLLLTIAFILSNLILLSQSVTTLNQFKYLVVIGPNYNDGGSDRYGLRPIVENKLRSVGFTTIPEQHYSWPTEAKESPCKVGGLFINHVNRGTVVIEVRNCKNQIIFQSTGSSGGNNTGGVVRGACKRALKPIGYLIYKYKPTELNESTVEKVVVNEIEAREYLSSQKNLNPIEGIYETVSSEKSNEYYKVFIKKSNDGFSAYNLESSSNLWSKGEKKFSLSPTSVKNVYSCNYSFQFKFTEKRTAILKGGLLTIDLINDLKVNFLKLYPEYQNIEERAKNSISTGTGFLIGRDIVVTNEHVISNSTMIKITTFEKEASKETLATVLATDEKNDVAILKLVEPIGKDVFIPNLSYNYNMGSEVFTIGFPKTSILGSNAKLTNGIVSSTTGVKDDPRYLQTNCAIYPGNSGGPLFNSKGEVLGITSASLKAENDITYSIKSIYISALLIGQGIDLKLNKTESLESLNLESKVKRVLPCVVYIVAEP